MVTNIEKVGNVERIVSPGVNVWGKRCPSYLVCGLLGLLAATLLVMEITTALGLSYTVMGRLIVGALLTFFGLTIAIKIITGKEIIVYYHHLIAVLGITAIQLYLMEIEILLYLDIMIMGIGMFQAYGRIGCFLSGCCHGRPCIWGVSYGSLHEKEGFPTYYVGVRLFPIQLVESVWILTVVMIGVVLKLGDNEPGTALAWYIMAYGTGRFIFEFARGDTERKYLWGYSEAQWLSLLLMGMVMSLEWRGILPSSGWHTAAPGALMVTMLAIHLIRRLRPMADYRYPPAAFVDTLAEQLRDIETGWIDRTKIRHISVEPRLHLSGDIITGEKKRDDNPDDNPDENVIYLYTISSPTKSLTEKAAGSLTRLIGILQHPFGAARMKKGMNNGIFHVLVPGLRVRKEEPALKNERI